ncbi:unnamed protein product (macronuclear) [Paramecium tetraurelia]|uniref:IBB domain-containing protein n=1 Tax=Paramecium tetraurelia TaxID=5888 RepID=A0BMI1_PARTE|nr:uncharacterized protein GSPATT00030384001 [Paramecium tetraurelia]CAK59748.1 unnamed protein product [Paramecium tetraurelia]|eukprot:XP_001427146.1 hypothetical protein (macronuclear) [Paramecium tetraurelia strain d4-2]
MLQRHTETIEYMRECFRQKIWRDQREAIFKNKRRPQEWNKQGIARNDSLNNQFNYLYLGETQNTNEIQVNTSKKKEQEITIQQQIHQILNVEFINNFKLINLEKNLLISLKQFPAQCNDEQLTLWFQLIESLIMQSDFQSIIVNISILEQIIIQAIQYKKFDSPFRTLNCLLKLVQLNDISILKYFECEEMYNYLIYALQNQQLNAIVICEKILEISQYGTLFLLKQGLLDYIYNFLLENFEYKNFFITFVSKINCLNVDEAVTMLIRSKIFNEIINLHGTEIDAQGYRCIGVLISNLIQKVSNKDQLKYLIYNSNLMCMLQQILSLYHHEDLILMGIQILQMIFNQQSYESVQQIKKVDNKCYLKDIPSVLIQLYFLKKCCVEDSMSDKINQLIEY